MGNLSYDASESDLLELFSGSGRVKNAEVVVNNNTHAYWLRVRLGGGLAPFDCTVFAVRILYRVSTPLP